MSCVRAQSSPIWVGRLAPSSSDLDSCMAIWLLSHEDYWLWNITGEANWLNYYFKKWQIFQIHNAHTWGTVSPVFPG